MPRRFPSNHYDPAGPAPEEKWKYIYQKPDYQGKGRRHPLTFDAWYHSFRDGTEPQFKDQNGKRIVFSSDPALRGLTDWTVVHQESGLTHLVPRQVGESKGYHEATTTTSGPFLHPPFHDIDMDRKSVVEKLRSLFPNVSEDEIENMLFGPPERQLRD